MRSLQALDHDPGRKLKAVGDGCRQQAREEPGTGQTTESLFNLFKEWGFYPKGRKKPLKGFKKRTDMIRFPL